MADDDRRAMDGKLWAAIEDLRRGQAVREQKLEAFEKYQRERNHDILNEVSKVDAKVELLRIEIKQHYEKEDSLNASFFKKGVWFLGAVVTALIGYIWQTTVGK